MKHGSKSSCSSASCQTSELDPATTYPECYESTAMIPVLFQMCPEDLADPPGFRSCKHRPSTAPRRLTCVRKPRRSDGLVRLRTDVLGFHALRSSSVAQIQSVFEDERSMQVVSECCTGGTIYERILGHQYFMEQDSAIVVKHMLQAISVLHSSKLAHGFVTPGSFLFYNQEPQSPLKLVNYGFEQRVYHWSHWRRKADTETRRVRPVELWENGQVVFCSPEKIKATQELQKNVGSPRSLSPNGVCHATTYDSSLDFESVMEDGANASFEDAEKFSRHLATSDSWGIGAIAFFLLCGYPPFFAPCRKNIVSRIVSCDFAFDPPFWSKITEEAKDFVLLCLRLSPEERLPVREALLHPWVHNLAGTSPCGAMLNSFASNVRRFHKASLLEGILSNCMAAALSAANFGRFMAACWEIDYTRSGFVTSSMLQEVLLSLDHGDVAETVKETMSNWKSTRLPSECYVDYLSLAEAVRIRKERDLEESLWIQYLSFSANQYFAFSAESSNPGSPTKARIFMQSPAVVSVLSHCGVEDPGRTVLSGCKSFAAPGDGSPTWGTRPRRPGSIFLAMMFELAPLLPTTWHESPGDAGRRPRSVPVAPPNGDLPDCAGDESV